MSQEVNIMGVAPFFSLSSRKDVIYHSFLIIILLTSINVVSNIGKKLNLTNIFKFF